jgi:hypothetical protein
MSRFLAEDFRNIMDAINRIAEEDKPKDTEQPTDPTELLVTDRPHDIEKASVKDVNGLIDYLDQFPELSKYRDLSAQYDDAFYDSIPLTDLLQVADLSKEDLDRINNETEAYEGDLFINNDLVSIFGGD